MKKYQVVIIGGGAAGIVTAMGAAGIGLSVALIEKSRIGGECSWSGCVPSKALLAAGKEAQRIRHAAKWGITLNYENMDVSGVPAKVRELTERAANRSQTVKQLESAGVEIYYGTPRFITANEVDVNGTCISGKDFVIATGSSPVRPEGIGLDQVTYFTNQEIFDIQEIPASLAIIGGGAIGIEMAQAFQRLGSAVTVFQSRPHILPNDDMELADSLTKILRQEGIGIHLGSRVHRVEKAGGKIQVMGVNCDGADLVTQVDTLLVAAGRQANVAELGLDKIGVEYSGQGIKVDKYLRTAIPHIWACGDCTGKYQFAHIAEVEARVIIQNILLPVNQSPDYAGIPWATFTDPELAQFGLTEKEAIAQGIKHQVYRQPLALVDRGIVEQEDDGMIKLIVRSNGQILGAQILGVNAAELINELVVAKHSGVRLRTLSSLPHIYPSWGYGIQRAIDHWLIDISTRWYVQFALKALRKIL